MNTSFFIPGGLLTVVTMSLALSLSTAHAQQQQPPQVLEDKGFVEGVSGNSLTVKLGRGDIWVVNVPPNTKVTVTGAAEPDYLHSGQFVKFSGEVDKKGTVLKEVEQIEIISPAGKPGAFDSANPDKPVKSPAEGTTYELRGRVASFKTRELTVSIGSKKVTAKTTPGLTVSINSDDISLVQQGDTLSLKAWYTQQQRPNVAQQQPGYAVAEHVSVAITKALAPTRKQKPLPVKGGRPPKVPEVPEVPNPFAK